VFREQLPVGGVEQRPGARLELRRRGLGGRRPGTDQADEREREMY